MTSRSKEGSKTSSVTRSALFAENRKLRLLVAEQSDSELDDDNAQRRKNVAPMYCYPCVLWGGMISYPVAGRTRNFISLTQ